MKWAIKYGSAIYFSDTHGRVLDWANANLPINKLFGEPILSGWRGNIEQLDINLIPLLEEDGFTFYSLDHGKVEL